MLILFYVGIVFWLLSAQQAVPLVVGSSMSICFSTTLTFAVTGVLLILVLLTLSRVLTVYMHLMHSILTQSHPINQPVAPDAVIF